MVEAVSSITRAGVRLSWLLADSPAFRAACGAANREEALTHILMRGQLVANWPSYPIISIERMPGPRYTLSNDSALTHLDGRAMFVVVLHYRTPADFDPADNDYLDASNVAGQIMDDIPYLLAGQQAAVGRVVDYPVIESIEEIEPTDPVPQTEQDKDGNDAVGLWVTVMQFTLSDIQRYAERKA